MVPSFFPPSEIRPGSLLLLEHLDRLLSLSFLYAPSPPVSMCSADSPPVSGPPIVRLPSSVRRRATNPPSSADQFPLLVSRPSVPYAGLHPPPTCAAGGTWPGCGWGGKRRETGTARIKREIERHVVAGKHLSHEQVMPADETTDSRPPRTPQESRGKLSVGSRHVLGR